MEELAQVNLKKKWTNFSSEWLAVKEIKWFTVKDCLHLAGCFVVNYWTPGRADRGPINSVPSVRPYVRPSAMGISRECFIQFFRNLA